MVGGERSGGVKFGGRAKWIVKKGGAAERTRWGLGIRKRALLLAGPLQASESPSA